MGSNACIGAGPVMAWVYLEAEQHQPSSVALSCGCTAVQENSDVESLPEEARVLLSDKDALVNALQV